MRNMISIDYVNEVLIKFLRLGIGFLKVEWIWVCFLFGILLVGSVGLSFVIFLIFSFFDLKMLC